MSTVKRIAPITLFVALLLILMAACNRATTQSPAYGETIRYAPGEPLAFPDVTLEFVGKREAPLSSDYPQGMTFYDFKVYQGSQAQLISWSAGTGDIGPTLFELAGNSYVLELAMSDELGSLAANELVLWQEAIPATEAPLTAPDPTPTAAPPITVVLDEPFSLAWNQYGRLDGTELGVEFYALDEDSRCPQQETCDAAGAASLTIFVWKTNVEPIEYGLSTDPAANKSTVIYDEYQIRLLSLDPYPETAEPGIAPQEYRATLVITK